MHMYISWRIKWTTIDHIDHSSSTVPCHFLGHHRIQQPKLKHKLHNGIRLIQDLAIVLLDVEPVKVFRFLTPTDKGVKTHRQK